MRALLFVALGGVDSKSVAPIDDLAQAVSVGRSALARLVGP